jgi:putative DNA primase/helicase
MFPKHYPHLSSQIGPRGRITSLRASTDPHLLLARLTVYETALEARRAGMSVVPVLPDGKKRPGVRWRIYQQRLASIREIAHWFGGKERGLALVTGAISGGLEALDFDSHAVFQAWSERVRQWGYDALYDRLTCGYLETTPHGVHLLYRCCAIDGNQKLASVPVDGPQRLHTLIETRGEGGLVIIAPSGGEVHPGGKPYVLLAGGISTITTITTEERQALFTVARSFDQRPLVHSVHGIQLQVKELRVPGQRPGDRYNQHASWAQVLETHGWRMLYACKGVNYWQRPGKKDRGISATTNYQGSDLLYVFSTSTPFEAGRAYSKFAAYAILEHGGDFSAAARALVVQEYAKEKTASD